jgi:hypothetical protein
MGCLRSFVEKAWPVYQQDPQWFRLSLDYFLQARIGPFIETRSVFLNILADRIEDRFKESAGSFEIDHDLKAKMKNKEFQDELTRVFEKITENWSRERTKAIIQQVNQWNSGPSFAEGIRRACRSLRLPEPPGKLLVTRHKLLHEGELKPHDGDIEQYWLELDWLVLSIVLRLFDYDGPVYHHRFGASHTLLRNHMVALE